MELHDVPCERMDYIPFIEAAIEFATAGAIRSGNAIGNLSCMGASIFWQGLTVDAGTVA